MDHGSICMEAILAYLVEFVHNPVHITIVNLFIICAFFFLFPVGLACCHIFSSIVSLFKFFLYSFFLRGGPGYPEANRLDVRDSFKEKEKMMMIFHSASCVDDLVNL
ncbi:hypothetical protein DFH27DRAFT_32704 [Peziza echinospora]|nr:hypothetical protein DFH27DRAFT_32704 [Peziza echinospora]